MSDFETWWAKQVFYRVHPSDFCKMWAEEGWNACKREAELPTQSDDVAPVLRVDEDEE